MNSTAPTPPPWLGGRCVVGGRTEGSRSWTLLRGGLRAISLVFGTVLRPDPLSCLSNLGHRVLGRCRRRFHRLRRRPLTNFHLWTDYIRGCGDLPAVKTFIHSPSPSGPSSHVAMLTLLAVVMLHAAVLLPMTSPMDKRHRAVRHVDRGRSCRCSAAALEIALPE